jgi:hypothetical protein
MEASRDQNGVACLLGVSSADGVTPVPIYVEPVTGAVEVELTTNPSLPATLDLPVVRDGNRVPVLCGVTDDANEDIVPLATDTDGRILCDVTFS